MSLSSDLNKVKQMVDLPTLIESGLVRSDTKNVKTYYLAKHPAYYRAWSFSDSGRKESN